MLDISCSKFRGWETHGSWNTSSALFQFDQLNRSSIDSTGSMDVFTTTRQEDISDSSPPVVCCKLYKPSFQCRQPGISTSGYHHPAGQFRSSIPESSLSGGPKASESSDQSRLLCCSFNRYHFLDPWVTSPTYYQWLGLFSVFSLCLKAEKTG